MSLLDKKDSILPLLDNDARPDLLISIDYTKIGLPRKSFVRTTANSVEVYIGLTNDTDMTVYRTIPTTIPPGVNLMGTLSLEIRQLYTNVGASALGILTVRPPFSLMRLVGPEPPHLTLLCRQQWKTIMISRVLNIFPDPQAGIDPHVPRLVNTSTFRVFLQDDPSEWITILDERDESFVNGLSRVGGLWAFFGGVFTILFGSSILRVLFGKAINNLSN